MVCILDTEWNYWGDFKINNVHDSPFFPFHFPLFIPSFSPPPSLGCVLGLWGAGSIGVVVVIQGLTLVLSALALM